MFPISFSRLQVIRWIIGISLLLAVGIWIGYNLRERSDAQQAASKVFLAQQQAQTPEGQMQAAHEAGYRISDTQAAELAQAAAAAVQQHDSKEVIQTTGKQWQATMDSLQRKYQGNWLEIYDPNNPKIKPQQPKPEQTVNLAVSVVKAYPPRVWTIAVYPNWSNLQKEEIRAAELTPIAWRFKAFGAVWYVGPSITYDKERQGSKVMVGPRLIGTF